jgi:hypothetical protein
VKKLHKSIICLAIVGTPLAAMAQTNNHPLTRAEVRQELVDAENAGYKPGASDPYYPADIQAAEKREQQMHAEAAAKTSKPLEHTGYGASTGGASASGVAHTRGVSSTYFGN